MRIHQIVMEAPKGGFALPPSLNPEYYQMTDSLRQISQWRARNYTNNNDHGKVGEMVDIGYVMISLRDNTIIPISRGDEHHTGYDLLYDLKGIDSDDYIPVYALGTSNYIYYEKDIPDHLVVYEKFLSYGGLDSILTGARDLNGRKIMLSDFVKSKGFATVEPGTLAPLGKKIYDDLVAVAAAIQSVTDTDDRIKTRGAFLAAVKMLRDMPPMMTYELGVDGGLFKEVAGKLKLAQKENDLQALREIIFGFHGFKNTIHNAMKKGRENTYSKERMAETWGDLDLAIDLLGRI